MKAYELLSSSDKWTQDFLAKREMTEKEREIAKKNKAKIEFISCNPCDERAIQWCASGALMRCYPSLWPEKTKLVKNRLAPSFQIIGGLAVWNNLRDTKFEHVQRLLRELDV